MLYVNYETSINLSMCVCVYLGLLVIVQYYLFIYQSGTWSSGGMSDTLKCYFKVDI